MTPAHVLRTARRVGTYLSSAYLGGRPILGYVSGWLGHRNLGDEALLLAARRTFDDFALVPYDGGRAIAFLVDHVPKVGQGLLAGGTIIGGYESWLAVTEKFLASVPHLFVFGSGVADPEHWSGKGTWQQAIERWASVLSRCSYVGVRGPLSAALLADAGVGGVEVVGDPVIAFADEAPSPHSVPATLGLNVGVAHGRLWGSEAGTVEEFARLARLARDARWQVSWFVVWPEDLAATKEAARASGTGERILEVYEDPVRFMDLARPLSVFVGMKLHATILATCALVPSVMIEYRPKCRDYMESIGQGGRTFRTDEPWSGKAWETARELDRERERHAADLHARIGRLRRKQRQRAGEVTAAAPGRLG